MICVARFVVVDPRCALRLSLLAWLLRLHQAAAGPAGLVGMRDGCRRRSGKVADSPGSRLVLVPMEATAMAGGIAQAMELLRAPELAAPRPPSGSVPSVRG